MTKTTEATAIIAALRGGLVPSRGLEHFATGLSALQAAVNQELDFVASGQGLSKWLRGKPTRLIALEGTLPVGEERADHTNTDFKVWVPPQQGANT